MTLAETQALLHALVTGQESVDPDALGACFTGTAGLPAAERVEIYANMWLWRQVDALRADFAHVAACLGDDRFLALCEAYVREHPSEHHDIGRLGRHLAAFLRRHPASERPDLADLAELEWARAEVFFEAGANPVGREALAGLAPRDFLEAKLRLVPALRLLVLDQDAAALWRRLERGEEHGPVEPGPVTLAVWRAGHDVFHATLDLDEALALELAIAREPLARVCAAFARREDPAGAAFSALASWIDEGWVAGVDANQSASPRAG